MPAFRSTACLLLLCLTACTNTPHVHVQGLDQNPKDEIRIAYAPWPGFDILAHTVEADMYAKHGIKVRLLRLEHQSDLTRALLRGQVDIATNSLWDMSLAATNNDDPPVMIACTNISHGSDGIVAKPGINTVKDLAGKTIGCKLNSINSLILYEALAKHGIQHDQVTCISCTNKQARKALEAGDIDAAVLWEPDLSDCAANISGKVIHTTADVDSLVIDGIFTRQSVIEQRPEAVRAVIATWFDLQEQLHKNPNVVFASVSKTFQVEAADFAKDYAGLKPGTLELNRQMASGDRLQQALTMMQELLGKDVALFPVKMDTQFIPQGTTP